MRSLISCICADGKPCNNLEIPWTNSCLHFALLLEILLTMDDDSQDENILLFYSTHCNAKMQCLHQLSAEAATF